MVSCDRPSRLARWLAEVDGDLHVGGKFRARFTSGWDGTGRLEVCEPPRLLLVTLSPGQEDATTIEARLFADADQTRLVIEERGLPLDELAEHGAGWPRTLRISPRTSLDMRPWTGAGGGLSSPRPIVAWQTESRDARLRYRRPSVCGRAANTVGREAQRSSASLRQADSWLTR